MEENQVYQVVGETGFRRLVAAFYRQVPGDDVLGPMYPAADLAGTEERLLDFLVFRFGGPLRYLETRGHPRLRMRHAPFAIDPAARDRWLRLMTTAMRDTGLPEEPAGLLRAFFESTATFLINRQR